MSDQSDLELAEDIKLDRLVDQDPEGIRRDFRIAQRRMEELANVMKQSITTSEQIGWSDHQAIWNIALFLNLAALDLSIAIEHVIFERDHWRRIFYSRQLVTLTYEATEDHIQLLGTPIRECLVNLGLMDEFESELRVVKSPVDQFWKENREQLKALRNSVGAHREKDSVLFLSNVADINPHRTYRLAMDLSKRLYACGAFLQKLMEITAEILPTTPSGEANE